MEFAPIGLVCLVAAAIIIARPTGLGLIVLASFIPLQTAAAFNLSAVGNVSIICAHVLIGALVAGLALRPRMLGGALRMSARNVAVLLLAVFAFYAIASAFMMPRLFEGEALVYSLERTREKFIALSALRPSTGNFTQSFYIGANFVFFAVAAYFLSRPGGLVRATHAINAITAVHLVFAVASMAPNLPPTAILLDFVRTANYTVNAHHTMAGAPRIIGSYVEPAAFGAMSAGLFAWNFTRFIQTRGVWHLCASALLLMCVFLSFSSTAYATLIALTGVWSGHALFRFIRRGLAQDQVTALLFVGVVAAGLIPLLFLDSVQTLAQILYERLFATKMESASGVERTAWNMQGLRNLVDTNGFGVGLGSARTSGLTTALLGNVGVIGTLLYAAFLNRSFLRSWPGRAGENADDDQRYGRRIFAAAQAGAIALFLGQLIAGTVVDAGLMFFLFAAVAAAALARSPRGFGRRMATPIGGLRLAPESSYTVEANAGANEPQWGRPRSVQ